jgi:hypothetical protein
VAELSDQTVKNLDATLNKILSKNSTSSSSSSGGGAQETAKGFDALGKATVNSVADLAKFGGTLFSSGAKLSDAYAASTSVLGNFGSLLGGNSAALSAALEGTDKFGAAILKAAESGVDTFRTLASSGASFNNNILELKNSAAQSRLTLDEFAGIVSSNTAGFAAFGGTVTKGAKVFTDASKDLFDTGMATPLLNMGMTFEEVNEDLAEYIIRNRRRFTAEEIANGKANASFAAMSTEMDKIAKLTGQNRKEMEKDINDRMRKGQVEAKIRMLEASGNKEAADKMKLALAEAQKAGPGALAAVEDLFTKGAVVSEEGRQAAVALGPAFHSLTDMVNTAKGPGGIDGMNTSISNFNSEISKRITDPNFLQIATLGGMGNATADAAAAMVSSAGTYADNVNALMEKENLSREAAIKQLSETAKKEQENRDATTSVVVNGEKALRDMGAIINEKLIGENGAITEFSTKLEGAATTLETLNRPQMTAELDKFLGVVKNAGSIATGSAGEITPDKRMEDVEVTSDQQAKMLALIEGMKTDAKIQTDEAKMLTSIIQSSMGPQMITALETLAKKDNTDLDTFVTKILTEGSDEQIKGIAMQIKKAIDPTISNRELDQFARILDANLIQPLDALLKDATLNVSKMNVVDILDKDGKKVEFDKGTLGKTGSLIQDFGKETEALLHGKEAVLTVEQLENIAKGAPMIGIQAALSGLQQAVSMVDNDKIDPMASMQNLFKGLEQTISSPDDAPMKGVQSAIGSLEPTMRVMATNLKSSMGNVQADKSPQQMQSSMSGLAASLEKMGTDLSTSFKESGGQDMMKDFSEQLNSTMGTMTGELMKGNKVASKQLKSIGGLSGNLFKGLG